MSIVLSTLATRHVCSPQSWPAISLRRLGPFALAEAIYDSWLLVGSVVSVELLPVIFASELGTLSHRMADDKQLIRSIDFLSTPFRPLPW